MEQGQNPKGAESPHPRLEAGERRRVKVKKQDMASAIKLRAIFRERFPACKLSFPGPGQLECATHPSGGVTLGCAVPFFWRGIEYAHAMGGAQERGQ